MLFEDERNNLLRNLNRLEKNHGTKRALQTCRSLAKAVDLVAKYKALDITISAFEHQISQKMKVRIIIDASEGKTK